MEVGQRPQQLVMWRKVQDFEVGGKEEFKAIVVVAGDCTRMVVVPDPWMEQEQ